MRRLVISVIAFFGVILLLHLYLLWGEAGETLNGGLAFGVLFLLLSGVVLWWPRPGQVRQRFTVKKNASRRRQLFDWHNVFGVYFLPVLIVLVATGISIVLSSIAQRDMRNNDAPEVTIAQKSTHLMINRALWAQ